MRISIRNFRNVLLYQVAHARVGFDTQLWKHFILRMLFMCWMIKISLFNNILSLCQFLDRHNFSHLSISNSNFVIHCFLFVKKSSRSLNQIIIWLLLGGRDSSLLPWWMRANNSTYQVVNIMIFKLEHFLRS